MSRSLLVAAAAAGVLALGGTVALAAPTTPASPTEAASALPGPKQPIEHLGLSGGLFADTSGEPGCFGASGTKSASFPVPRGALVTGLTAYVIDSTATAGVSVSLNRHDLTSGGTFRLGNAFTSGSPGSTTLVIEPSPGVLLTDASSVNVDVAVGKSTCLKGVEVHFIRDGAAGAQPTTARAPEPTVTATRPDGAVR